MRFFAGFMACLLAAAGPTVLDAQDTLRVLRHAPGDTASPASTVTVMFDRPVAGALDSTVSAARVFHVTPQVAGSAVWRDPITIRFIPSAPLAPGARYTITIDTSLRALDGTHFASSYQFDFRVIGPRLLARSFDPYSGRDTLAPDGRIRLLYTSPVDLDRLARGVRIELTRCSGPASVMYRAVGQHRLASGDPSWFQWAGEYGDTIASRFRTVVDLEPAAPLPVDCGGFLVIPTTQDDSAFGREERYGVRTTPVFRLLPQRCPPEACASDGILIRFSSPVRRADVLAHVRINGEPVVLDRESTVAKQWSASVLLVTRSTYTVGIDSALRDVYGRPLEGPRTFPVAVDDYAPLVSRPAGILTVPRSGPLTLPIRSTNVRSIRMIAYRVPDSVRIQTMSTVMNMADPRTFLGKVIPETTVVALPDRLNSDTTADVPLPPAALAPDHPLVLLQVAIADSLPDVIPRSVSRNRHAIVLSWPYIYNLWSSPYALLQVTDLAVTARLVGTANGSALVTGLADGRARRGVAVTQFDMWRRVIGRGVTDARGVAALERVAPDSNPARTPVSLWTGLRFSVLQAESADDRVTVSFGGRAVGYQPGSQFEAKVLGGRNVDAPLAAGAVFADRGIYRPGEVVYLKGVVRRGMLGALLLPATADSARISISPKDRSWYDDSTVVVRDSVQRLSLFGTIVDSLRLRPGLTLQDYSADLRVVVDGHWRTISSTSFRLAEYRAPDFLVDVAQDTAIHYPDDTLDVEVRGQVLFGSPLRGGQVRWTARMDEGDPPMPRGVEDGWTVGEGWWWGRHTADQERTRPVSGVTTLDANGRARIRLPVASLTKPASGNVNFSVGVTDVDQQVVTATADATISSSRTYILARLPRPTEAWRIGKPARIDVRAVNENGVPIPDAAVRAVALRLRINSRDPDSNTPTVRLVDTIADRRLTLAHGDGSFSFVPDSTGSYAVLFTARDSRGGPAITTISRSVAGPATIRAPVVVRAPPGGFRLVLVADSTKLAVGDVAHVRFDSPFRDAEAWITIEREGIIEERRQRASRGENVLDVPIHDGFAPNVFVSVVLVARDELARPYSARDRLRAGYVELSVNANRHKLSVAVTTDRKSYAPRDTASIGIRVRDSSGRGVRSEISVWAVDEGVLSLTGFSTPDLRARIYEPRGVGSILWSTVPTLVTTDPMLTVVFLQTAMARLQEVVALGSSVASASSAIEPTVRSRFASTAFYLGRVETDARGNAVARARVPDNLTTFRVMAVATSAGDQYGSGDTTLLVTRPLVARAVLPRFLRPGDSLVAGVVVTARDGRPRPATTDAATVGAALRGPTTLSVSLTATASSEARFVIQAPARDAIGDTITVRLGAGDGVTTDATETRLPVHPDYHQRMHAMLGAVRDTQTLAITLPPEIDPARSRMRLRIGTSRTSAMLAAYRWLRAYPYDCTEQLSSVGRALIAVWRSTKSERSDALGGNPHGKLQELVDEISKRQSANGSIKYWPNWDWSSPWLSSYAGMFLLDARDAGVKVDPTIVRRIGDYLTWFARQPVDTGGINRYEQRRRRLELGERVAIVDYLRRAGAPDTAAERALLRVAAAMTWEDRLRLAEVIAARKDVRADAEAIVDAAWRAVTPAGHRADLPDTANGPREFPSRIAPAARLLSASLELRPTHPMLGALVETVLQQGRAESRFAWSTQDYASVVMALSQFREDDPADRIVSARAGGSSFVAHAPRSGVDTTITAPLTGMLETAPNGEHVLRVHVDASVGQRPVYYALEVDEVPLAGPVKPDIQGLVVERWYERFDNGAPVTRVNEGDLVRVRLRITAPADREFVAVEDPLPAGLEPIDLGLRTSSLSPFTTPETELARATGDRDRDGPLWQAVLYGGWDDGHWSPWEHKELHDDRVSYFARMLWTGSYTASYVARATTAGSFVVPPAYAEEMYNPALQGRSGGGRFLIDLRP